MAAFLTIDDLLALPHLGLELAAGAAGSRASVMWTHTSELEDPGPWMEGGELLIVNGFGIPSDPAGQREYVGRLARHRIAGLAVSVKAPPLTTAMLDEADRLGFPVLRVPRHVPFLEISHLVANASEQTTRGRLSRHLRIFETLRYRNSVDSNVREIYAELEQVSGYRLALLSPAGYPLLPEWDCVPTGMPIDALGDATGLRVIPGGYVLPLRVGERTTAYLIGMEEEGVEPGGLAALQHVGTLAALDAVDDQRRRESEHRRGSACLTRDLDVALLGPESVAVLTRAGGESQELSLRVVAASPDPEQEPAKARASAEIEIRDWLTDRGRPHLLVQWESLVVVVLGAESVDLETLSSDLALMVGASQPFEPEADLRRMLRQALWAHGLAQHESTRALVLAEEQFGLGRWLTPDTDAMRQLARGVLDPLMEHDREHGSELVRSLTVYFQKQGRIRRAAEQLFVHEHTLAHRLKRVEQLTGRNLKSFRDSFELWLAIECRFLIDM